MYKLKNYLQVYLHRGMNKTARAKAELQNTFSGFPSCEIGDICCTGTVQICFWRADWWLGLLHGLSKDRWLAFLREKKIERNNTSLLNDHRQIRVVGKTHQSPPPGLSCYPGAPFFVLALKSALGVLAEGRPTSSPS